MTLLKMPEIAEYLGLSPNTVKKYVKKKAWDKIPPPIVIAGGTYRWDKEGAVEKWLQEHQLSETDTETMRNVAQ